MSMSSALIPQHLRQEIEYWDCLSDQICQAGRAIMISKLSNDRDAQIDALPSFLPQQAKPYLTSLAKNSAQKLSTKYMFSLDDVETYEDSLDAILHSIHSHIFSLNSSIPRPTILNTFSYADITIAASLQMILPLSLIHI